MAQTLQTSFAWNTDAIAFCPAPRCEQVDALLTDLTPDGFRPTVASGTHHESVGLELSPPPVVSSLVQLPQPDDMPTHAPDPRQDFDAAAQDDPSWLEIPEDNGVPEDDDVPTFRQTIRSDCDIDTKREAFPEQLLSEASLIHELVKQMSNHVSADVHRGLLTHSAALLGKNYKLQKAPGADFNPLAEAIIDSRVDLVQKLQDAIMNPTAVAASTPSETQQVKFALCSLFARRQWQPRREQTSMALVVMTVWPCIVRPYSLLFENVTHRLPPPCFKECADASLYRFHSMCQPSAASWHSPPRGWCPSRPERGVHFRNHMRQDVLGSCVEKKCS